jgi:16S rRNA (cytidine1402-2'-O)-methyltransferase
MAELAHLYPERRVAVVRELTKIHEEVLRGTVAHVSAEIAGGEVLGEIVVVLEGAVTAEVVSEELIETALREHLDQGQSLRDAVSEVADHLGVSHRETYARALRLRADEGRA